MAKHLDAAGEGNLELGDVSQIDVAVAVEISITAAGVKGDVRTSETLVEQDEVIEIDLAVTVEAARCGPVGD